MPASLAPSNELPDYAAEVTARLAKDYAELLESVAAVLARLRALPLVENEEHLAQYATVLTEGRDLRKRLIAYHDAEKAPFLRGGQGCDNFFFGAIGRLGRRGKADPAGGLDVAEARVDDFMQMRLAAERAAREAVAAEELRKANEIRKREEDARRAADEAAAKAARARNAETIAAHQAEAQRQAAIAETNRRASVLAEQQAEDARIDTKATAADMTRTRLSTGALATMKQVGFVQILDRSLLNMERLLPHLDEKALLQALDRWAKVGGYKIPMAGAIVEMRDKGKIT